VTATLDQGLMSSNVQEITVHDFSGRCSGDVYDQTQTDNTIKDGDVLDLGGGNVAVMVRAWPTIVVGEIEYFQRLQQRETFEAFEGGRYAASAVKAREVASKASNRGYALTGATDLSSLDDHVLVAELQRRGNLVHCWSAHDFEPVLEEDEDVLELELTDEEREIAQKQAFEQACGDLDSIVISRGNEHLSDWWEQNKESILLQFTEETVDGSPQLGE